MIKYSMASEPLKTIAVCKGVGGSRAKLEEVESISFREGDGHLLNGLLDDVVSKVAPLLSQEKNIVNVIFVYDADTFVVSQTVPIPRKSLNKVRLSFSVPERLCQTAASKMDAFAFPLKIWGISVCVLTNLDASLLSICPGKCVKVKINIRHQKKQGSVELSSVSRNFLLGECILANRQELATMMTPSTRTHTQASMSTTALNEFVQMMDDNDLFGPHNDLCSLWPQSDEYHTLTSCPSSWKDVVLQARRLISEKGCGIHNVRQMFDIIFSVFTDFDEFDGVQKQELVTTKYILTTVSDEVRSYLVMDMLDALESGPDAIRIWTDVTLKCLGRYTSKIR